MRVLLVFPPLIHHAVGETIHASVSVGAGAYPPIGLLYLASYLHEHSSHEVEILDASVDKLNIDRIQAYISRCAPDVVGVYTSTYYLKDSFAIVRAAKAADSGVHVVAGGPHFYFYPDFPRACPELDYVVHGEGEVAFAQLLDRLAAGQEEIDLPGVIRAGSRATNPLRIQDLDTLPIPDRRLIEYERYSSVLAKENPITSVMSSRGCPYNCDFCGSIVGGHQVRFRSAESVVDELDEIVSLGIHDVLFFDELFTLKKKRVIAICKEILARKLDLRFHLRSRADTVDEEQVKWLKRAGCRLIQFGIESGTDHIQKVLNKNLDLRQIERTVKIVRDAGILTYGDFMIGSPEESPEEIEQTIRFAQSLKLDYAQFGITHTIPRTALYERALREGLHEDVWHDFVEDPSQAIPETYWPGLSREELERLNRKAYLDFYLRPSYFVQRLLKADSLSQTLWAAKTAPGVFRNLLRANLTGMLKRIAAD